MPFKQCNLRQVGAMVISAVTCLLQISTAQAQITVSKSVLEFSSGNLIQDVEIQNSADYKIFLNMSVAHILDPADISPTRVELTDPRTSPVLVSPKQLLIPPGQRKRLRVILRQPPTDIDSIYRLTIKPFIGDVEISNDDSGGKASALKVLLGYDLLLVARPENAQAELDVERTEQYLRFANKGNTNILIRRMIQCDRSGEDCVNLQPNRLYAGETYEVELPKQGSAEQFPVQVWQAVGLKNAMNTY